MLSNKMCTFHTLNIAEVFLLSQSRDELIIQAMVIARNKRLAERFLVLLEADYYKDVASFNRTFNLSVGVVFLKFLK